MPTVTIVRRDRGQNDTYEQTFSFESGFAGTVVDLLHALNARETLTDADGQPARRICFECSCESGRCGACAMRVNDKPVLACEIAVTDALGRGDSFRLAPLTAYPCICDLQVDRGILHERERAAELWLKAEPREAEDGFFSACLKCGLCAEVCEKYHAGRFDAPCAYAAADLIEALEGADNARRKQIRRALRKPMLCPCKTPTCETVCPQRLPLRQAIKRVSGSILPIS